MDELIKVRKAVMGKADKDEILRVDDSTPQEVELVEKAEFEELRGDISQVSESIEEIENKKISHEAINEKTYDTSDIFGNVSITQARDTTKASLLADYLIPVPTGATKVKYVVKVGFLRPTDNEWLIATVSASKTAGVWNSNWQTSTSSEDTATINQTYSKFLTISVRVLSGTITDFKFNLDCISIYFDTDGYSHDYIDELRNLTGVFTDKLSKRLNDLDTSVQANKTAISNVYSDLFNSSEFIGTSNYKTKVGEYSALFNNTENVESFMFFTDPHLLGHGYNEASFRKYIGTFEKAYNSSPCAYVVCGGDWLVNNDTQAEASEKLGYLIGVCKSKFRNLKMIVGNHDYNYQGKLESGSPDNSGTLSASTIKNLWYPKEQHNYYKFHDALSDCYVFDTDLDWNGAMTAYRYEQAHWFAESLLTNSEEHILMFAHIYANPSAERDPIQNPFFLAKWVADIASAFNRRTTITVDNHRYDFSNVTVGKVHAFFAGHTHYDIDGIYNGLPIIITTNATSGNVPTFDFVLVDYYKNVVNLKRVGNGSDRTIQLN